MEEFKSIDFICTEIKKMKLPDAIIYARDCGYSLRVVKDCGIPMIITCDYRIDRINLNVEGNDIIGIEGVG